jgi:hypothetical protein
MRVPFLAISLVLALASCTSAAHGGPRPWNRVVLLELFTSQGCSSCPAADALVRELPQLSLGRDKVVPLTFHVDYWNGLGWKDPFSSPAFTARQQRYADSGHLRSPAGPAGPGGIYTPQVILNGTLHLSGARRSAVLDEISRAAAEPAPVSLQAEAAIKGEAAVVDVHVSGRPRHESGWVLYVALAQRSARTQVPAGENEGRTLEEAAVVRVLSDALPVDLHSTDPKRVTLSKPPRLAWSDVELVAFVQSTATLEVGGASAIGLEHP